MRIIMYLAETHANTQHMSWSSMSTKQIFASNSHFLFAISALANSRHFPQCQTAIQGNRISTQKLPAKKITIVLHTPMNRHRKNWAFSRASECQQTCSILYVQLFYITPSMEHSHTIEKQSMWNWCKYRVEYIIHFNPFISPAWRLLVQPEFVPATFSAYSYGFI